MVGTIKYINILLICVNFVDTPLVTPSLQDLDTVTKRKDDIVAFDVHVNKNTPAMVKWFHNGAMLSSSADRRVEISNENSEDFDSKRVWTQDLDTSLTINNITCDDIGFYQVEISNPVETVIFTYRLNVENCKLYMNRCH